MQLVLVVTEVFTGSPTIEDPCEGDFVVVKHWGEKTPVFDDEMTITDNDGLPYFKGTVVLVGH